MRRPTATLLLVVTLLAATPTFGATRDRGFVSRVRSYISHILHLISPNDGGDNLTPPKP